MTPRRKRLLTIAALLLTAGVATVLVLNAFRSNLVFFYSPSDVDAGKAPAQAVFRIGGLVETGSLARAADGITQRFVVTDGARRVAVEYRGILPDLFREGRGVVAQGRLDGDGRFSAQEVLAKHDENYMPPEAADALERARLSQTAAREAR